MKNKKNRKKKEFKKNLSHNETVNIMTPSTAVFNITLVGYPNSQLRIKLVGEMLGAG